MSATDSFTRALLLANLTKPGGGVGGVVHAILRGTIIASSHGEHVRSHALRGVTIRPSRLAIV